MKLFDISKEIDSLLERRYFLLVAGESTEQIDALIKEKMMDLNTKADSYIYIIRELKAGQKEIQEEINRLTSRKRALESKETFLKETMLNIMQHYGLDKIKTNKNTLYFVRNKKIHIAVDADNLPNEFIKIRKDADKTKLKKWILAGNKINGVELKEGISLGVR